MQRRGVVFLFGEAGIGKTESIHQLRKEFSEEAGTDIPLVTVHSAHYALQGAGLPMKIPNDDTRFRHALPEWFPKEEEYPRGMIFFDEFNQAPKHVRDMFFSMIEDRKMHEGYLPKGWIIVAAMNPSTSNYEVNKIEQNAALRRRVKMFFITENTAEWKKHARTTAFHARDGMERPCHPMVLDWVMRNPREYLHNTNARDSGQQYPCPATIQTVSLDAWIMEDEKIPIHMPFARNRYASSIGVKYADILCSYIADNQVLLDPTLVMTTYSTDKALRNKVKSLLNTPGQQARVIELSDALANRLFTDMLPVEQVAPNLADFFSDLPNEQLTALFTKMYAESKEVHEGTKYMQSVSTELMNYPAWTKVSGSITKSFIDAKAQFTGGELPPDPM